MIQSDDELKVTRERISYLLDLLARLRVGSRPEEVALVTGGYRTEVERMQREVLDYLTQPATQTTARASPLDTAYSQMAREEAREAEALEWAKATAGELGDDPT